MSQYFNVSTNAGDAAIAYAIANNTKLNISHVAFGDGNGAVPTPDKLRTTLVHEVHRQAINKYTQHPTVTNWITVEAIIPSGTGGFWIREIGIIADGIMITHGSHAPFYKVADTEGVSEYRLKFTIDIQDASIVQLTLDESLIYATQAWVNENYIPRTAIIDNLTTADAAKPLSSKQGKALQDNKLGKFDNAATATKLATARKINGVSFDGSTDINLPDATTQQKGVIQLVNDLTTGGVDKALTAEQGKIINDKMFGVNQTNQDVTASRALNTNYTNLTDKPIFVSVRILLAASSAAIFAINGVDVSFINSPSANGQYLTLHQIVLPNETYKVYQAVGTATLQKWVERKQ